MRNHIKKVIVLTGFCLLVLQSNSSQGQTLSRPEFREQLRHAVKARNTDRVHELFRAQRGEGILFMEALIDSAFLKRDRGATRSGEEDLILSGHLAQEYQAVFGDEYYRTRTTHYLEFDEPTSKHKATLIRQKNAARQVLMKGEFAESIKAYRQTLDLATAIGETVDAAVILGNMGIAKYYLGELDSAMIYYQEALDLLEDIGDQRRIGNQLGNIAGIYSDRGDHDQALAGYRRAMSIRRDLNDQRGLAADLNNIGLIQETLGAYNKAIDHYRNAMSINKSIDNPRSLSRNLANLANIHIHLGDYRKAIEIYDQALALRRSQEDRLGEGNDLGNSGLAHQSLGDYGTALALFQRALAIHRELDFQEGVGYQLGRIAELHSLKGEYGQSIKLLQEALEIHRETGHVQAEASWLAALGEIYAAVSDYAKAEETLNLALELQRKIENPNGQATILAKKGRTYLEMNDLAQAQQSFEQALQIHRQLGKKGSTAIDLINLSHIYGLLADSARSVSTWKEANILAIEIGERRLQSWLQLQQGDFYRDHRNYEVALKAYESGLALSERLEDPELRWNLYYGLGQLREARKDNIQAANAYRTAIEIIEGIRGQAVAEQLKAGVIQGRYEVYESAILTLIRMGEVEEALVYVERARARNLLDLLGNATIREDDTVSSALINKEKSIQAKIGQLRAKMGNHDEGVSQRTRETRDEVYRSELNKAYSEYSQLLIDLRLEHPRYAAILSVELPSMSTIQALLDARTAVLEYFMTPDRTYIFVVTDNQIDVITVDEGRERIQGRIALLRGLAVQNIDANQLEESFWISPARKLHEVLIQRVEMSGHLRDKDNLIIVPQGVLHYLPFQALVSETKGDRQAMPRFLIEDYAISYLPSASALKYFRRQRKIESESLLLLAPQTKTLPKSSDEVLQIAEGFGGGAQYHFDDQATETLLKSDAGEYDIIHLATTAQFNKTHPLFSSIHLASSDSDDGRLETHEIYGLGLRANLVTLSACQTALGSGYTDEMPYGDDLISLTQAFHLSGSPSVVASLWEVSDQSTAVFMKRFYAYLKNTDKAQALAQAQRDMIKGKLAAGSESETNNYRHPYFWAPFVFVGDRY